MAFFHLLIYKFTPYASLTVVRGSLPWKEWYLGSTSAAASSYGGRQLVLEFIQGYLSSPVSIILFLQGILMSVAKSNSG